MKKATAILTDDKKSIQVNMEGPVTFQEGVAFSNAILLFSIDNFKEALEHEEGENKESYLGAMYDDLNLRFINILDSIIPQEDNIDFTEQAQQALRDEDEYIDLKFKAMQYEKITEKLEDTKTKHTKVTLEDNGELSL